MAKSKDGDIQLRCRSWKCDVLVTVTAAELEDPKWRPWRVNCPKHSLKEKNDGTK